MTARRKETGETMELIPGMGTKSFRVALLVLVLSMHPIGRSFLGGLGFKFPDEQKLVVATEKASDASREIQAIKDDVRELKEAISHQTASNLVINTKLDEVTKTLTGFHIDLEEFRKHTSFSPKPSSPTSP